MYQTWKRDEIDHYSHKILMPSGLLQSLIDPSRSLVFFPHAVVPCSTDRPDEAFHCDNEVRTLSCPSAKLPFSPLAFAYGCKVFVVYPYVLEEEYQVTQPSCSSNSPPYRPYLAKPYYHINSQDLRFHPTGKSSSWLAESHLVPDVPEFEPGLETVPIMWVVANPYKGVS
jgi:hypothetical protein